MLLKEMFSPIGAPDDEQSDINWLNDLKFFIDNDNDMLEDHFFHAVRQHQKYAGHPKAFKLYLRPINRCLEAYCQKYDIEDRDQKFPKDSIIDLAKHFAEQQEKFIQRGDYETK